VNSTKDDRQPRAKEIFRILSLDGGGIRGTFPAAFLARLEERLEHPIGSYFDLIAGTLTGGIIAIGLGLGLRAAVRRERPRNFRPASSWGRRELDSAETARRRGARCEPDRSHPCKSPSNP
jgi:predicted acylesterase/phospholipase RssA